MDTSSFELKKLTDSMELPPFKCSDDDLNEFFKNDAQNYYKELIAVTYILVDTSKNQTVAYFSLLNDILTYSCEEEKNLWKRFSKKRFPYRKRWKSQPSVKVGRFAVSEEYSHQGLGSRLLDYIKVLFTESNKTGCRFITLDAYADSVNFYIKNKFDFFTSKDEGKDTRLMYFDLKPFKDALSESEAKQ